MLKSYERWCASNGTETLIDRFRLDQIPKGFACEAERRPAQERIPDRLHWPAYLIDKLWLVDA